ncbi:MAG TPA: gas vesicle protein GvpG [Myxococcales bacterium]|jgi:hypothetical protein|nr:gas vesicle protein GvpG [Myxococcales bacterium]
MGLISAPFRGLLKVFEEVADRAEKVLYDEDAVKAELTDIYMKLEAGSLTEEEFNRREAELVQRLEEIEAHQKQKQRRARGRR